MHAASIAPRKTSLLSTFPQTVARLLPLLTHMDRIFLQQDNHPQFPNVGLRSANRIVLHPFTRV